MSQLSGQAVAAPGQVKCGRDPDESQDEDLGFLAKVYLFCSPVKSGMGIA
jgi:hypothetical protein